MRNPDLIGGRRQDMRATACTYRSLTLAKQGVMLGADSVILPFSHDRYGRPCLDVERYADRALVLASVFCGQILSPSLLKYFHSAARAVAAGDVMRASICLALAGFPRLQSGDPDEQAAIFRLSLAETLVDDGLDPKYLLHRVFTKHWEDQGRQNHGWFGHGHGPGRPAAASFAGPQTEAAPGKPAAKTPPEPPQGSPLSNPKRVQEWLDLWQALYANPNLTDAQRAIIAQIVAWEGGTAVDKTAPMRQPDGTMASKINAQGGITADQLAAAKKANIIDSSAELGKLTMDQIAAFYPWYIDKYLKDSGGIGVLDSFGDQKIAATLEPDSNFIMRPHFVPACA